MATSDNLLKISGLTLGYGETVLLDAIDFEVRRGEIFVILGGSGCGKSTLLKHLIGLYEPMAGSIEIEGEEFVCAEGKQRESILRKFGVMYQNGALFGSMTLLENIRVPLEEFTRLPEVTMDLVARMKLKLVGLEQFCDHLPSEISGGMQKRAAIARAMALDPQILFLDEPSAGLDPITSADLDRLIVRLSRSQAMTFVIVTHELPSIYTIADRVIMLDKETRGIIAEGHPETLRDESSNEWVRRFFKREAEA